MVFLKKKHIKSLSDEEILAKWSKNQQKVYWAILYDRYASLCFGVCLHYLKNISLAEDATMEIFMSLPKKIATTEVKQFQKWFYTIIKNYCLMELRKKSPIEFNGELLSSEPFEEDQSTNELSKEQLLNGMESCMKCLKLEQRICIEQFYIKEMTYQEIVKETGYELKKVKSYIQNGKRNIRLCMDKNK